MEELEYWVGFNMMAGVGPATLSRLRESFGDLSAAWRAPGEELHRAGLDSRSVRSIVAARPKLDPAAELERARSLGVQVITWEDRAYPRRLREIYNPPPILYLQGSLLPEDEWALAVVGTRKASAYGREAAERIASELARAGITIVSGLARGIDAVAHRAALQARGRTIAVFGCGLDVIYPAEHRRLAEDIVKRGALISEFPLGTRPQAGHFPRRNRIMSGLSLGTLVVEAGRGSGALITARYALEHNRDVFAVPGNIFAPGAQGTNRLIRDGAKLVTEAADILEELNLSLAAVQAEAQQLIPGSDVEALLLRHLSAEPTHIDELHRRSQLPTPTVSGTLAIMELKGLVKQVGGMNYVVAREVAPSYHA